MAEMAGPQSYPPRRPLFRLKERYEETTHEPACWW